MARARIGGRLAALAMAGALVLGACGGGGGDDKASTDGGGGGSTSTTLDLGGGTTLGGSTLTPDKDTGRVRVVNLVLKDGKPYGALDLYDVNNPGDDTEPVIAGLGYGEVSDYVTIKSFGPDGQLFVFAEGEKTKNADGIGGSGISNSGFTADDQATVAIGSSEGFEAGQINLSFSQVDELDESARWAHVDGKSFLLASKHGVGDGGDAATVTLVVDGKCPMRVNPEDSPGGGQGVDAVANGNVVPYEVSAGSHQVSLLATDPTTGMSTCDTSGAIAETTVDVAADGRTELFVYGTGPTDLKIAAAPVDEP